jgi:hypothetical protein
MSVFSSPIAQVFPGYTGIRTRDVERSGDGCRDQASRAAERHQRDVPRVEAFPDRHRPRGIRHVGLGDLDEAGDDAVERQIEADGESFSAAVRRLAVETDGAAGDTRLQGPLCAATDARPGRRR